MATSEHRRWDRFELTYSIWDYNPDLPIDRQEEAIAWAFGLWQEATMFLIVDPFAM